MTSMMLAFTVGLSEVYLFCLVAGVAFALISVLLGSMGHGGGHDFGGHDAGGAGGHDGGVDGGTAIHFTPLSPVFLAMFATAFGGAGLLITDGFGLGWWFSLPVATICGLGVGAVAFYFFARLVIWAQGSSQASVTEAMGITAEVITPVPANGVGEIAYALRDRRFTAPARSVTGQPIANHAQVTIEDVSSSTFLVRETAEEQLRHLSDRAAARPADNEQTPPAASA